MLSICIRDVGWRFSLVGRQAQVQRLPDLEPAFAALDGRNKALAHLAGLVELGLCRVELAIEILGLGHHAFGGFDGRVEIIRLQHAVPGAQ